MRFGVSEQRVNARVRRLLAAGLLGEHRPYPSASRAVYLSAAGAAVMELPRRKPPRADTQRRHELALAAIVAGLERDPARLAGARLLTERECRQAERAGDAALERRGAPRRPSPAPLAGPRHRLRRPSPRDRARARRQAHAAPWKRIVDAYQSIATFDEVLWLVELPSLRARLELLVREQRSLSSALGELVKPIPMQVNAYAPNI